MLSYISEDDDAKKAEKDFENALNQCVTLSLHTRNTLLKLVNKVASSSYSAGYANAKFDQAEQE